jgi:hypothetical protein
VDEAGYFSIFKPPDLSRAQSPPTEALLQKGLRDVGTAEDGLAGIRRQLSRSKQQGNTETTVLASDSWGPASSKAKSGNIIWIYAHRGPMAMSRVRGSSVEGTPATCVSHFVWMVPAVFNTTHQLVPVGVRSAKATNVFRPSQDGGLSGAMPPLPLAALAAKRRQFQLVQRPHLIIPALHSPPGLTTRLLPLSVLVLILRPVVWCAASCVHDSQVDSNLYVASVCNWSRGDRIATPQSPHTSTSGAVSVTSVFGNILWRTLTMSDGHYRMCSVHWTQLGLLLISGCE